MSTHPAIRCLALAAAALATVACGGVAPAKPSRPAYVPTVGRLELVRLLRRRDFDALERRLGELQEAFERDVEREADMAVAVRAFRTADPALEPILAAWLTARPRSAFAHLGRAKYFARVGWERRGGRWARDTSEQQFRAMAASHALAASEARAALALEPRLLEAHEVLLEVANAEGATARCGELTRDALRVAPASFRIRAAHAGCLLPRWGGSEAALRELAAGATPYLDANPRLAALAGFVDWDRGTLARSRKDYGEAVAHFDKALAAGEHWEFLEDRGWARYRLEAYEPALADFTRALELVPQEPEVLVDRGWALVKLGRLDDAVADYRLALEVDPSESRLEGLRRRLVHDLVQAARAAWYSDRAGASALLRQAREVDPSYSPR
ncbi:MAG TPA: tetratricopeptide repeat protein [Thermoanaerobaculia bacterium]|nr:tetratricopeptide repeat protein [Thermoanaerobaculia bacterium]